MSQSPSKLSRRTMFAGAGAAGAVAAIVSLLPLAPTASDPLKPSSKGAPKRGGGYSLSDHVKQYYKTTRV